MQKIHHNITSSVMIMNLDTQPKHFDISENTKCSLVRVPCFVLVSSHNSIIFKFHISSLFCTWHKIISPNHTPVHSNVLHLTTVIQGDTKKWELLKCVVAAMYSWQHCGTGTLSYRQPGHSVIMDQWNGQQRAFVIKMFYKNNDNLEGAQKEFRSFFNLGRHGLVPSKHAIKTWIKNFEETVSTLKKKPTGRRGSARTPQNIEAVRVSVLWSPRRSVCKLGAVVRLSQECVR